MICRYWRGWATKEQAADYQRILVGAVIPAIEARRIDGFLRIEMMRRDLPDGDVEFATLMWFESIDAVRNFAGEDYEAAHVPPAARAALRKFDHRCAHYEIFGQRDQI